MLRHNFPLFQSHLDLAHQYWQRFVRIGDVVIDATCGKGHDSLVLARLALDDTSGHLYSLDIQTAAIAATKQLLEQHLSLGQLKRLHLAHTSHSQFPSEIAPKSVRLIVYNLGYLPGGDKSLTTTVSTTLQSLEVGMQLIQPGGVISLTAYPGHEEGHAEHHAVQHFLESCDPKIWNCCRHQWVNRNNLAPVLFLIQRRGWLSVR